MNHDALLWLSFILIGLATILPRASFIAGMAVLLGLQRLLGV